MNNLEDKLEKFIHQKWITSADESNKLNYEQQDIIEKSQIEIKYY